MVNPEASDQAADTNAKPVRSTIHSILLERNCFRRAHQFAPMETKIMLYAANWIRNANTLLLLSTSIDVTVLNAGWVQKIRNRMAAK